MSIPNLELRQELIAACLRLQAMGYISTRYFWPRLRASRPSSDVALVPGSRMGIIYVDFPAEIFGRAHFVTSAEGHVGRSSSKTLQLTVE